MSKWKKGWKVVYIAPHKRRYSCTYGCRTQVVEYPVNKVAERPIGAGPLAVFATRNAARIFVSTDLSDRKARKVVKIVKCLYIESSYYALWENRYPVVACSVYIEHLPPRTILAEKVKCLE